MKQLIIGIMILSLSANVYLYTQVRRHEHMLSNTVGFIDALHHQEFFDYMMGRPIYPNGVR